jgi:hypothetical protein
LRRLLGGKSRERLFQNSNLRLGEKIGKRGSRKGRIRNKICKVKMAKRFGATEIGERLGEAEGSISNLIDKA